MKGEVLMDIRARIDLWRCSGNPAEATKLIIGDLRMALTEIAEMQETDNVKLATIAQQGMVLREARMVLHEIVNEATLDGAHRRAGDALEFMDTVYPARTS